MKSFDVFIITFLLIFNCVSCGSECSQPGVYKCKMYVAQSTCMNINAEQTLQDFYNTVSEPLCKTIVDKSSSEVDENGCNVTCSSEGSPSGLDNIHIVSVCEVKCSGMDLCSYTAMAECVGVE